MYRILAIEDDPLMHGVFHDVLAPEGYEVLIQSDGASGFGAAVADVPDLIILDVNLPDATGMEVCRRLKNEPKTRHIPVLMLTGEARAVGEKVAGLDVGAEDYLFKPISPRVLTARVKQLLSAAK